MFTIELAHAVMQERIAATQITRHTAAGRGRRLFRRHTPNTRGVN